MLTGGSATVSAAAGISVQALFRLKVSTASGDTFFEAAVNPSSGTKNFVIPFDFTNDPNGGRIYTGIAISNLDAGLSATVACAARDLSGKTIPNAIAVPVLRPLGHWADFNFPVLFGSRGSIECSSTTSIGAVAIHALPGGGISSLPVILK